MPEVNHVLLTRFNLPTGGVEGAIRTQEGWLSERVGLFERYCAPSVARQTCADLQWIVYFDPESPQWMWDRLDPFVRDGLFRPVRRHSVARHELVADIRETVDEPRDWLVTTNLDNDDALAVDFCARVRSAECGLSRTAIYVAPGLIKSRDGIYRRVDPLNAFCSVRESWDDPVTAWSEYHNEFPRIMSTVTLDGTPGWLQVVHGSNVSNRVRGRLVRPERYRVLFGDALDDIEIPRGRDLALDRLVRIPLRGVRDTGRGLGRRSALRILGKDRYQQLRLTLFARSGAH